MNYAGKFDATSEGQGAHTPAYVNIDSSQTHAPSDALIVPDAQLLFHADYSRSGTDLVLTGEDRHYVVHDYFKGSIRAPLASRDGAHLTSDIVKALVGEVHLAQASNTPAPSQVIGHVTKLQGSAAVIRNGVSIILNNGDNVEKGDVVQSGANSTVGITFIDGTVFGLSSNARMVLNEMVYDPNGSSNSSLMSLVAGTITFVAGETAKHGDMKVDTPVATMGIRGTAVLVEIDFSVPGQSGNPNASFQVLVEPDGTTGSYILFDKTTLQPIAIVNQAGQQLNINNGIISQTTTPLSPELQKLINETFTLKFTDNNNPNTKTTTIGSDTLIPTSTGFVIKSADGSIANVFTANNGVIGGPNSVPQTLGNGLSHISGFLKLDPGVTGFVKAEFTGKTGDVFDFQTVGGQFNFTDINPGDRPTISTEFSHVVYSGAGGSFNIGAGQTTPPAGLNALQFADIAATAIKLFVVPGANNTNNGSYTWLYSLRDNAFDFLGAGESLTFTYHVTLASNYANGPEFAGVDITITVIGTNDQPVITTSAQTIDYAAGISTPGGMLTSSDSTTGTFAFTDVDLTDTHKVSTKLTSAVMSNPGGTVPPLPQQLFEKALFASVSTDSTGTGDGVVSWRFGKDANGNDNLPVYLADFIPKGETLTLTYTVTVTDSQGATSDQTVTVTITGTDSAAVVWIDTKPGGGSWNDGQNWETGTVPTANDDAIVITNQLIGLTPSYPVTVDHAAAARSLTMNDFGDTPPVLINYSTLDIGAGGILAAADSVVNNQGTLTVVGKAEFVDQSVLQNSGLLKLSGGGDFADSASITNFGTIEVAAGTLNVVVDITNGDATHSGTIKVDSGAVLTFAAGSVSGPEGNITVPHKIVGGTVNIVGTLDLEGSVSLQNGTLNISGLVDVTGSDNALDNESGTNSGQITLEAGAFLTLDQGTDLTGSGTVTVKSTATLTVNGATVDGNTITNQSGGTVALTGSAVLKNGTLGNSGQVNVSGADNKLDKETINNTGTIEVLADGALTIDQISTIDNTGGHLTVDDTGLLTLNAATVTKGTVTNNGETDLTGTAVLNQGTLGNSGQLKVSGAGNALHAETITNTGTIEVLANGALTIDQVSTIGNTGGQVTVDGSGLLTLNAAIITNGTVTNSGETDLTGSVVLQQGTLDNSGQLKVSGAGNALDKETITNTGTIEVLAKAALTIDQISTVDNTNGHVTVDSTGLLTLNAAAITAGTVTNNGEIDLTGSTLLGQGTLNGSGQIKVSGTGNKLDGETVTNQLIAIVIAGELILESGTSVADGTLTNAGTVHIEASGATLDNVNVNNAGGVIQVDAPNQPPATLKLDDGTKVASGALSIGSVGTLEISTTGATLTGVSVEVDSLGVIQVDAGSNLTLSGTTISGGTINDGTSHAGGSIDVIKDSTIENAALNNGTLTIEAAAKLTLDGDTVSGTTIVDLGSLEFDHTVKLTGGATIQGPSGEALGSATNLGTLEVAGAATLLHISLANVGETKVDSGQTLTLEYSDISGGTLTIAGTLDATGDSNISGVNIDIDAAGVLESTDGTLIIDPDVPLTIVNHGLIQADGGELTIAGEAVTNVGTLQAINDSALTLSNLSVDNNGGVVSVEHGSTIDLFAAGISGGLVNIYGELDATGLSAISASIANAGTIEVVSGTLKLTGSLSGAGSLKIDADATLELGLDSSQDVTFGGAGAKLIIDGTPTNGAMSYSFAGHIHNLGVSDSIDLAGVTYSSNEHAVWTQVTAADSGSGILQIYDGSGTLQATLNLAGIYSQYQFALTQDGTASHGTDISIHNYISFSNGTINSNGIFTPEVSNAGSTIELTNGANYEATSWFDNSVYSISKFTASFDYSATGSNPADGMAFILHNSSAGLHALGGTGHSLGYGGPDFNQSPDDATAISPSAAIEFNLYAPYGQGTAFATDGDTGNYNSTGSVAFAAGDQIQAIISYDGSVLSETLIDLVTGATYSASHTVDLGAVLGGSTAFVGFSAATGGSVSTQTISNFVLTAPVGAVASASDTNLALHQGPVIETDKFTLLHNGADTTIEGLQVNDSDATGTLTLTTQTEAQGVSEVDPATEHGNLATINAALGSVTYSPGSPQPTTDMVTMTVEDLFGHTDTVNFIFDQGGSREGLILTGTSGKDVIFASGQQDTLTGNGGQDQFVFKPTNGPNDVQHTITDFNVDLDTIDVRNFGNNLSVAQILASAHDQTVGQETDTLLTLDNNTHVLLKNVHSASLHVSDFIVAPHGGMVGA